MQRWITAVGASAILLYTPFAFGAQRGQSSAAKPKVHSTTTHGGATSHGGATAHGGAQTHGSPKGTAPKSSTTKTHTSGQSGAKTNGAASTKHATTSTKASKTSTSSNRLTSPSPETGAAPAPSPETGAAPAPSPETVPAATPTLTPTQQKLQRNTNLSSKLQSRLPAGTDLMAASAGFRNLGQFVAAVNVSNNLGIPFRQLKAKMVTDGLSLGQSIQALKPVSNPTVEVQRAETDARVLIQQTDAEQVTAPATTPTTARKTTKKSGSSHE